MKTLISALFGIAIALSTLIQADPAAARYENPDMAKFCRSHDKETTETLRRIMTAEAKQRSRYPEVRLMAVHETWEKVLVKCMATQFSDVPNPVGWVRTVVRNNVFDQYKAYCRQLPGDMAVGNVSECQIEILSSIDDDLTKKQKLEQFLMKLSPRVKEVAMFMLCGVSEAETAAEMGISEATVSSHRQTIWHTCSAL